MECSHNADNADKGHNADKGRNNADKGGHEAPIRVHSSRLFFIFSISIFAFRFPYSPYL